MLTQFLVNACVVFTLFTLGRILIWPFLYALLAACSYMLLEIIAIRCHFGSGTITWHKVPRVLLRRYGDFAFDGVPCAIDNNILTWYGIFRWYIKPPKSE
jgi:hypothetical protein